jgi:hypothetical protein
LFLTSRATPRTNQGYGVRNRRNYYRILHVQPEAPLEVIRASYRGMMTKMRLHPDLGGDHETAVLVNEAYAVLSDPVRRERYDRLLRERDARVTPHARRPPPAPSRPRPSAAATGREASWGAPAPGRCVFCGAASVGPTGADARCPGCQSPLAPAHEVNGRLRGASSGRRDLLRLSRDERIVFYPEWPHRGLAARLRDLSPAGIGFVSEHPVPPGCVIKISSAALEAVARVVALDRAGGLHAVHAELLTVEFPSRTGVFVAATA